MPYAPTAMSLNWMWFLFFSFVVARPPPVTGFSLVVGGVTHPGKQEIPWETVGLTF